MNRLIVANEITDITDLISVRSETHERPKYVKISSLTSVMSYIK